MHMGKEGGARGYSFLFILYSLFFSKTISTRLRFIERIENKEGTGDADSHGCSFADTLGMTDLFYLAYLPGHCEEGPCPDAAIRSLLPSLWGRVARSGRVRDRTTEERRTGFSRTLIRLLRRHLPPRGRLTGRRFSFIPGASYLKKTRSVV